MSAKEKEIVLKQWRLFLKKLRTVDTSKQTAADYGYFPTELDKPFTERLYKHLSLHCGFIAHYNRRGFLSARFGDLGAITETIQQLEQSIPYPGFRDLNQAMKAELRSLKSSVGAAT